jgi:hypothetical protein
MPVNWIKQGGRVGAVLHPPGSIVFAEFLAPFVGQGEMEHWVALLVLSFLSFSEAFILY